MFTSILDTIGDWNPQVLRELKGHLKPVKILLAITLAVVAQIVFLLIMFGQIPTGVAPSELRVTTYPALQLDYEYDGPLSIVDRNHNYPLEKHPNYDISNKGLEQYANQVLIGDRILAVNDIPLNWNDHNEDGAKQAFYDKAITRPFAEDIRNLSSMVYGSQAAQNLRQQVPGTMVHLTLERGASNAPVEVELPLIVESTRTSVYCLPLENWATTDVHPNRYNGCFLAAGTPSYQVDWTRWHQDAFWALSIATIFPLLILGSYGLISNLLKEERAGTLNFIRLSPQSAWDILFGKMLGVPGLIYLAVGLTLPLNLFHGLSGGVPWWILLSFYGATVAIAFLLFSLSLLVGMINMGLGIAQAWLGAGSIFLMQLLCLTANQTADVSNSPLVGWVLMFTPFSPLRAMNAPPFIASHVTDTAPFSWFGIPMVPVVTPVLLLVNTLVLGHWVWKALERRFFSSAGTLLAKGQSYGLTLVINVSMIGFGWIGQSSLLHRGGTDFKYTYYDLQDHFLLFTVVNGILWVLLIIALSPQRQSLYDWARYYHLFPKAQLPPGTKSPKSSVKPMLWQELLFGEKSPAIVAIALNLLIGAGCMFLWVVIHSEQSQKGWEFSTVATLVLIATINVMLLGTAITQFIFIYREKHPLAAALLALIGLLIGTPLALNLLGFYLYRHPEFWLTFFPWASIYESPVPAGFIIIGMLGHWSVLGILSWWLTRIFRKIGASESKQLLRDGA